VGKDISHALILCDSKNIIHRDIKPTNIMVSQYGDYKLGDFGVSKTMDHTTFATAMGTPEYQAPEVLHMEKYGSTADIYSLGITLYWLLNNRKMPFIGADEKLTDMVKRQAMERRYRGERLPEPQNGSAELKRIVLKACEYRPQDRYASAKELYEALDALNGSETNSFQENGTTQAGDFFTDHTVTEYHTTASYEDPEESNSWGESFATIGNPGGKPSNDKVQDDNFASETVGKQNPVQKKKIEKKQEEKVFPGYELYRSIDKLDYAALKLRYKKELDKEHPNKDMLDYIKKSNPIAVYGIEHKEFYTADEESAVVDEILAKIDVEKTTKANVVIEIILVILFLGGGVYFLTGGRWIISGILLLIGIKNLLTFGEIDFNDWMAKNRKKVVNIDDIIRIRYIFAKRLYYEKCPNKHMLKYIKNLNPAVEREIKASLQKAK
jgi:hypothetical protein